MSALLRADWLRFRARRDFWVIFVAVLLITGIGFVSGYHSEATDPAWPDAAAIRQDVLSYTDFSGSGMTQAEIDTQIDQLVAEQTAQYEQQRLDWEAQQAVALQKYDIAQSPFTLLGSGLAPLLALILLASFAVGDEFRFGTLRTSLLAAGGRGRFLGARLTSLLVMTVGLFAVLALLGIGLGLGLRVVGAEVTTPTTPIDLGSALAWFGAHILAATVLIALGTALTMLLRSGALPLVIILVAGVISVFVAALPIFAPHEFLWAVPQIFLTTSIDALTGSLGLATHAIALSGAQLRPAAIDLPPIADAAIIAAWGLLFVLAAERRFRMMDILE